MISGQGGDRDRSGVRVGTMLRTTVPLTIITASNHQE